MSCLFIFLFYASRHAVKYPAPIGFKHFYQQLDNAFWSIELPSLLSFCKGKLSKEILENMTKNISTSGFRTCNGNIANQIDQTAKTCRVEIASCKDFWQNPFKRGILLFDGIHGVIYILTDFRLSGF